LEIEALKGGGEANLKVPRAVGLYILNEKRAHLARLHATLGLFVTVVIDDDVAHAECQIERTSMETRAEHAPIVAPSAAYEPMVDDGYDDEAVEDEEDEEEEAIRTRGYRRRPAASRRASLARRRRRSRREGRPRGRRRRRRGRRDGEPREAGGGAGPGPCAAA
jgi:ribonuclease E